MLPNPQNITISTTSAGAIALWRFVETTIIMLLPSSALAALSAWQQQLASCTPGATATACAFHYEVIIYAFVASLVAGAVNALTAYVSKTNQIAVAGPTQPPAPAPPTTGAGSQRSL